jgi:transcriptional regulator with XRE-family HTH domain
MASSKKSDILGPRIRLLRLDRGLSIKELADSVGVHRNTMSDIENGKFFPNPKTLLAVSKFFNLSVEKMLASEQVEIAKESTINLMHRILELENRINGIKDVLDQDLLSVVTSSLSIDDRNVLGSALSQNKESVLIFCKTLIK